MSQSFADRLVKSIELSGHKQVHLAKKLEISKQAVNQWAHGIFLGSNAKFYNNITKKLGQFWDRVKV